MNIKFYYVYRKTLATAGLCMPWALNNASPTVKSVELNNARLSVKQVIADTELRRNSMVTQRH